MARQIRLCKNNDGNKHYSRGYCQSCYMRVYRGGAPTPDSIEEPPSDGDNVMAGGPLAQAALDDILSETSSRLPSVFLATEIRDGDSAGIKRMRSKLAGKAHLARREVVKTMLFNGLEDWQVTNEFLVRKDLFDRFVVPLKDPDRVLDTDMNAIKAAGLLNPLARYIEGIRRSLRRANAFADNPDLSAKERSSWAKSADEIQRNLAILENAIHVVPGKGDMPVGYVGGSIQDDEYDLPDVEGEEGEENDYNSE